MEESHRSDGVLVKIPADAVNYIVQDGIRKIGDHAGADCFAIETIEIPEGVEHIGLGAFEGCGRLREIVLPQSLRTIENRAFECCESLSAINLPDGIEVLRDSVFYGCGALTGVKLPEKIKSIESHAFEDCTSLRNIDLPPGLLSIGDYAFAGCPSLEALTIPTGAVTLGYGAINGCRSLEQITLALRGIVKQITLPAGKDDLSFFCDNRKNAVYISYVLNGVLVLRMIPGNNGKSKDSENNGSCGNSKDSGNSNDSVDSQGSEGIKTFSGPKDKLREIYGKYISSSEKIIKLFDWIEIRDNKFGPNSKEMEPIRSNNEIGPERRDGEIGPERRDGEIGPGRRDGEIGPGRSSKEKVAGRHDREIGAERRDKRAERVEIPPYFMMDAMGKKISRFFYYRKRFFGWNKENPYFKRLNVGEQTKIFGLLVMLGGFDKNDEAAQDAYAIISGLLANPQSGALIEMLANPPEDCVPLEDARTLKTKVTLFKTLMNDAQFYPVAIRFLNDYKRIRKQALKEGLDVEQIDVGFIQRFIGVHSLYVRDGRLGAAIQPYESDMEQVQALFLEDLFDKATAIYNKHRDAAKAFAGGIFGQLPGAYEYLWPKMTDPRTLVLGFATGSCFRPPGLSASEGNDAKGVSVLGEAVLSYDVAPLIILDENDIAGFAVVNYNAEEYGLLVDNVEVVAKYQNPESNNKMLRTIVCAISSMTAKMNQAGRRVVAANIRYDKNNDLMGAIKSLLPVSGAPLRVRNYSYGDYPVYSNERGKQWNLLEMEWNLRETESTGNG